MSIVDERGLRLLPREPEGAGPTSEHSMDAILPAVMTVAEVAEYLRIPRSSVYKLAQRGKIPCQKVGRHWRFRREAVDTWLDSAQSPSGADAKGIPES